MNAHFSDATTARENMPPGSVMLDDLLTNFLAAVMPKWEGDLINRYAATNPTAEETMVIYKMLASDAKKVIVTYGRQRIPDKTYCKFDMLALALRQHLCEMVATAFGPTGKATRDIGGRRETRLRSRISFGPQYVWALLPYSRRVTLVVGSKAIAYVYNRLDYSPLIWTVPMPTSIPVGTCLDAVVDVRTKSFVVFDVISDGLNPLCSQPLAQRMTHAPKTLNVVKYASANMYNAASSIKPGQRLLIADPGASYRPNPASRDAFTWKPPYPSNTAVLYHRCGEAMSLTRDDFVALECEGRMVGAMPLKHMTCYVCSKRSDGVWEAKCCAKRGDPLYTHDQCGKTQSWTADMFAPKTKPKDTPTPDPEGFVVVAKKRR